MAGLEVGLAIPGLIDVIIRSARIVGDRIKAFRNADEAVRRLQATTTNLREWHLYLALEALKVVWKDRRRLEPLAESLELIIEEVQRFLSAVELGMAKVDTGTFIGRALYTLSRGRGSQHQLAHLAKSLDEACTTLTRCCLELYIFKNMESSYLLTSDNFVLFHEEPDHLSGESLPDSDILVADGSHETIGKRVESSFIIELTELISKCLRPGFQRATELVLHLEGLIAARKQALAI